jgi:hypothetical protein
MTAVHSVCDECRAKNVAWFREKYAIKCDCGEYIYADSPHVQVEADRVLWHGNAEGGGHRADYAKVRGEQ